MAYIKIADDSRIAAASRTHHCGNGEIEVDIPAEIEIEAIHEYRYIDGAFIHDPELPTTDETGPTQEERIKALEDQLAAYEAAYVEGVNEA